MNVGLNLAKTIGFSLLVGAVLKGTPNVLKSGKKSPKELITLVDVADVIS